MTDADFLRAHRDGMRAVVDFFNSKNKTRRERLVCINLLKTLGVTFSESDVKTPSEDPPDVTFEEARFEIKEIMDPDRRRHQEYKDAHKRACEANSPDELIEDLGEWVPITPADVVTLIQRELKDLRPYAPSVREALDLLFYVNLKGRYFEPGPVPTSELFAEFGWRSVTVYANTFAIVVFANACAPHFLKSLLGTVMRQT